MRRRVGSITLGVTLIVFGVSALLAFVFNVVDMMNVFKFWPVTLVLLGLEVLFYTVFGKEEKLKYDGVSIFLIIMLILFAFGASAFQIGLHYLEQYGYIQTQLMTPPVVLP